MMEALNWRKVVESYKKGRVDVLGVKETYEGMRGGEMWCYERQ